MRFTRGTARLVLPALLAGGLAVAAHAPGPVLPRSGPAALPPVELVASGYSRSVPLPARTTCPATTCVNASAHGADGTDRLSDSSALKAAATAAASARKVLWLPAGTYVLTTPFRPPAGLTLAGAGIDRTVLKIDWASVRAGAFGYSFAVHSRPEGGGDKVAGVTVQDLTVHGSRNESGCAHNTYSDASDPDPLACKVNQAGGIGTGPGWTVRQVRLTNLNYFKIGIFGVDDVKVLHCRFDNDEPGVNSSGGEDNIGGGSGASRILVEGNRWAPSSVGNALDLTVANGVVTRGNTSWGSALIYEGVVGGRIEHNVLHAGTGGINLKPNSHYEVDSVPKWGIRHTTGVTVSGNRVTDPGSAGIAVMYFPTEAHALAAPGTHTDAPTTAEGGGNTVRGNTIVRPAGLGIIVGGSRGAVFTKPDRLEDNTIVDVGWRGSGFRHWFPHPAGIGVTGAAGTVIGRNTVVDTRTGAPVTTAEAAGAVPAPTGPQTGSAIIVGATSPGPQVSPNTAVVRVDRQSVRGLWAEPVRWHVAVPTAVSRPDERGATVTVTGYGLDRVDRRAGRAGITVDGVALTDLTAPTAPDATGLSTMTAVVPPGTGTASLALRTTDGRTTSATAPVRYGLGVDATLPAGTVLPPGASSVRVTTSVPVGATAGAFAAERLTATVDGVRASLTWAGPTTVVLRTPVLRPGPVSVVLLRDGVAGRADTSARVAAVVTRLDRVSGPAAGGTSVTVTGLGLAGATDWRFGSAAASCTVLTPATVRCAVPPGTPGTVQVRFDPAGDVPFLDTPGGRWTWR